MKNFFNNLFPEKNENYDKAISNLTKIKKRFDGFVIDFPDVTPNEIMFIKNKWEMLPKNLSDGVEIMALKAIDNCKTLLTSYNPYSYVVPHSHNEFEYGMVLKGRLTNKLTGRVYTKGDTYMFVPNETHFLTTKADSCLVYSALNSDPDFNIEPLSNKMKLKLQLA